MTDNKEQNKNEDNKKKKKKAKGPIRFEAVIPVFIVIGLLIAYFTLFFDSHLKYAIETAGYYLHGAEVNIEKLDSSFSLAAVSIEGIEITNPEAPERNLFSVDRVRFKALWDGLLRAKFVVDEMSVEGVRVGSQRKSPGKVRPVDLSPASEGGAIGKAASEVGKKATDKIQEQNEGTGLASIAAIVGGADPSSQLENIEQALQSQKRLQEIESSLKTKQEEWKKRIASLPNSKTISSLTDEAKNIKTSGFRSPEDIKKAIADFKGIENKASAYLAEIQNASTDFNNDLGQSTSSLSNIDSLIQQDIKDIEQKLKIPSLDVGDLSRDLFMDYVNGYIGPYRKYLVMARQYMPQSNGKKASAEVEERQRQEGRNFQFGRPNSYPLFWVKKTKISSKADNSDLSANLSGEMLHLASEQKLTGKPTTINVSGNVPSQKIQGIEFKARIDRLSEVSKDSFTLDVSQFPVAEKTLSGSDDVRLVMKESAGQLQVLGLYQEETLSLKIENKLSGVSYDVDAKDATVKEIMSGAMKEVSNVQISARARGPISNLNWVIKSSVAKQLERAFSRQLSQKLSEAKKKVEQFVRGKVDQEKKKVEAQISGLKNQIGGEIDKVKSEASSQKSMAQNKAKGIENQANEKIKREQEALRRKQREAEEKARAEADRAKRQAEEARRREEQKAKKAAEKKAKEEAEKLKKKLGF